MQTDLPTVDKLMQCCDARDTCELPEQKPSLRYERPRSRADCASIPRPCPFVSCKYHLLVEVDQVMGQIRARNSHLCLSGCGCSCALDLAETSIRSVDELSEIMGRDPDYLDETLKEAKKRIRIHADEN